MTKTRPHNLNRLAAEANRLSRDAVAAVFDGNPARARRLSRRAVRALRAIRRAA